jgi:hypothetical protein
VFSQSSSLALVRRYANQYTCTQQWLTLELVRQTSTGWNPAETYFTNKSYEIGIVQLPWTVPDVANG